jgi:hypothetical protein
MDDLDFGVWNNADWHGVFAHHHIDDVLGAGRGRSRLARSSSTSTPCGRTSTRSAARRPASPPTSRSGLGDWTCVIGEFEDGSQLVTVVKWRDGAIAEEYI